MNHWFHTQGRIIRSGMQNFVRNATLAIAAMAVIVITLTIILFSVVTNATFSNTISQLTDKIDISVYLTDEITEVQREELIKNISSISNVKSVSFKSKEKALEDYQRENQNDLDLLLAISQTDNPLPASLQIKPKDPNRLQEIQTYLETTDVKALQSYKTSYSDDRRVAIDKISRATKFFRQAGIAGVVIFAMVSMLIIFNTIRMAIFNRREELTIMRLLGASTWFIRGPFVVETVLYGLVSAVVSVTLLNIVFSIAASAFEASSIGLLDIKFAYDYFTKHFWLILTMQLVIGILIGAVSSIIATRRYLKFKTSK